MEKRSSGISSALVQIFNAIPSLTFSALWNCACFSIHTYEYPGFSQLFSLDYPVLKQSSGPTPSDSLEEPPVKKAWLGWVGIFNVATNILDNLFFLEVSLPKLKRFI